MNINEVLHIALEAGEILLRNGAETYRVEDSIKKICIGLGFSCEAVVFPTGIFLTVVSSDQTSETSVRRIKVRTLNLLKIDSVNSFSRNLSANPMSYLEAIKELDKIKALKTYSASLQLVSVSAVTFAFAMLFGGSIEDSFAAMVTGLIAYILNFFMLKADYFTFLIHFVIGCVCGFLSLLISFFYVGGNVYIIIISSVILYLPGVSMTNGIRDLLVGDSVSGLTRLGEAILTVIALGMGVGLSLSMEKYFFFG
ncbi:MAG: threonine/serine exporter family protein [Ruminiclostridium sp.]|nr:threonine/serine exporter family protein [Ruminiclostridium sp.]